MENIRIGKPNATDEEVIEAAKKAQCMEFIKKFPEGFKTLAGDCGNQLSGGEKQRITLARAILKMRLLSFWMRPLLLLTPKMKQKLKQLFQNLCIIKH